MYKRSTNTTTGRADLSNYVEGYDLYNSEITMKLRDLYPYRKTYKIKTKEYRPDLIAEELYGSTNFTGLLIMMNGSGLEAFGHGAVIEYIPGDYLSGIID